ncbi:hypothetical protein [Flavobacterium sp.]|uniref:hypothetical protein n=1 Tax=Flavobacterium sp. TaxID=239 RepID=UPI0039E47738
MKTLQTLTKFSFIALALLMLSCNKDDDNNNNNVTPPVTNNPNSDSYVTGKVDGADFSSFIFGTSMAQCTKVGSGPDQLISILGGDMSANNITIALYGINATGTYSVNNTTNSFLNYTPGSGGVAYSTAECEGASGTITVTYIDNLKVEGTFSFTGIDTENCSGGSKTVTEGSFRGTFPR